MPIYQYKAINQGCDYCKDSFEEMQAMSANPLDKCPECETAVKKIPSVCNGYSPFLSTSNLKDKGFKMLKKNNDGGYDDVTK